MRDHPDANLQDYLPDFCFSAAYISTLLGSVYGLPADTTQMVAVERLQGQEVNWTFGAMIHKAMGPGAVRWTQ